MKVALCQIDPTVGDFEGNRRKILAAAVESRRQGAQWALFSELALCGYPPEDLLLRQGFLRVHDAALADLAAALPPDLPVLIGCLERNPLAGGLGGRALHNAVALCEDGLARIVARKCLLPTYDIFDEERFFAAWTRPEDNVVEIAGRRVGITICEDAWNDAEFFAQRIYELDPVARIAASGVDVIVNLSASPWNRRGSEGEGKERFRHRMLTAAARRHRLPILFCNQTGGDVGFQFDGGSMAVASDGVAFQPSFFEEGVFVVEVGAPWSLQPEFRPLLAMQHAAIVQGLAAYCGKFGFRDVVVGLSGGIDSALVATLAVDALGAEHVTGIAMPSTYSSEHSLRDARALARNLGIRLFEVGIGGLQSEFESTLAPVFVGTEPGIAEENLQARARGTLLMAYANKFGALLLTTGNKSECAVGYCTLYGDMNGALAPIADLWKTEVWEMARWLNREGERIPVASIEKPPSAELRPGQLDTDSLPPYPVLDPVLRMLVEEDRPVREVAERSGMPVDQVDALFRKVQFAEFKRYQYAPTLRVSERCWDGRRMPVSHRFLSEA
ncbi:MAG: NAD+ synthase [Planctomycetota bacterium]